MNYPIENLVDLVNALEHAGGVGQDPHLDDELDHVWAFLMQAGYIRSDVDGCWRRET